MHLSTKNIFFDMLMIQLWHYWRIACFIAINKIFCYYYKKHLKWGWGIEESFSDYTGLYDSDLRKIIVTHFCFSCHFIRHQKQTKKQNPVLQIGCDKIDDVIMMSSMSWAWLISRTRSCWLTSWSWRLTQIPTF